MQSKLYHYFLASMLSATMFAIPAVSNAAEEQHGRHKQATHIVIQKSGALTVTTPDGATYQLNPNVARRHGHNPFKEGDEDTVLAYDSNMVIDIDLKGQDAGHQSTTAKLNS